MNQTLSTLFGGLLMSLSITALALLWIRRQTVLDVWLMVMCCTWLIEATISAVLIETRFSLGWYAGRIYALIGTTFVLLVLLSETTTLYAFLARSVSQKRSEHEVQKTKMDAMAASIAHEVNQPLSAIVINAQAALRFLAKTPPNINEVRAALEAITSDGVRGNEVITSLRTMFKKDAHGRAWLNVNDLIRETLEILHIEIHTQRVLLSTNLREEIPRLFADRGQLHQVFVNLIMNAVEAMHFVTERPRRLRVTSDTIQGSSDVLITVEDSGAGIDTKDTDRIFEPFFTTKSTGTGIGLSICRSIIEAHGGSLRASASDRYGTIFHVVLPINNTE
jgi:Signal transduction histidine kinase regulating C4-dicarboxylate transport system